MKEDRTAFWFRIRVILSTLLVLLGAGLFSQDIMVMPKNGVSLLKCHSLALAG